MTYSVQFRNSDLSEAFNQALKYYKSRNSLPAFVTNFIRPANDAHFQQVSLSIFRWFTVLQITITYYNSCVQNLCILQTAFRVPKNI